LKHYNQPQWQYHNPTELADADWVGFIYLIENISSGRLYLGKKQRAVKRTLPPLKGRKRRRIKYVENWEKYWGSCEELTTDIKTLGHNSFTRTILHLSYSKKEMSYLETSELFKRNVLKDDQYYNSNIAEKHWQHFGIK